MISRRGFLGGVAAAAAAWFLPKPVVAAIAPTPMPTFSGATAGVTTFTLPDGTSIALTDWIDDKHYATIEVQLDKRNFGGAIEPFVARRRNLR